MADISSITLPNNNTYNFKDKRITSLGTLTLSLSTSGWSSKNQSVTATGVTANSILVVSPAPGSYETYGTCGVYASAQASNSITFTCKEVPPSDISANVLYINLG